MTLSTSVADDRLDQFYRRTAAIAERLDKSLPFDRVMDTLQMIHDGKLTPFSGGLRGRFIRTMSIQIGGVPKDDLIEQIKAAREVSSYADSMMRHKLFTTLDAEESITLIDLCPADLGFTENPTTTELFDVKRLAEWSKANLDGYIVDLCPAEVGPHLAIQYKDQPKGEVLWIAMERVPDSGGRLGVFGVGRDGGGGLWLGSDWTGPVGRWRLGGRIVFISARYLWPRPSDPCSALGPYCPLGLDFGSAEIPSPRRKFLAPRAHSF